MQRSNKSLPSLISVIANFLLSLDKALKTVRTFSEKSRSCQYTEGYSTKHTMSYWEHFLKYFTDFCVTRARCTCFTSCTQTHFCFCIGTEPIAEKPRVANTQTGGNEKVMILFKVQSASSFLTDMRPGSSLLCYLMHVL